MNRSKIVELLSSARFWATVFGALAVFGIDQYQDVDPNVVAGAIATLVSTFVVGRSIRKDDQSPDKGA